MKRLPLSALLMAIALPARAEVHVQQEGEYLSLKASAAPISEVLDRLSRHTGMQVVYEGAPPRVPVTLSIQRRTPAEAVFSLLEGLGLNYALRLDEGGARVMTLVMTGASNPSAAASGGGALAALRGGGAAHPPPPSYPQDAPMDDEIVDDSGVIPPPPPQPPQEFVVNPPPQADGRAALAPTPEPTPPPTLGAGFSSPFSGGGFSSAAVIGAPQPARAEPPQAQPTPPPPQFVPEQPPDDKEP